MTTNPNALEATKSYMEGKSLTFDEKNVKNKGSFSLGNVDERYKFGEKCYNYMISGMGMLSILGLLIIALLAFLGYFDNNPDKFEGKTKTNFVTAGYIILSIILLTGIAYIVAGFALQLLSPKGKEMAISLDATLTDITRLSTAPMSETELHSALTDTIANRVGMGDQDRAQLHYNIANSISFTGNDGDSLGAENSSSYTTSQAPPAYTTDLKKPTRPTPIPY